MRDALATLPWVETDSIKPDKDKMQVKFAVKDPKSYDDMAIVEVLKKKGYSGAKKMTGPTDK